MTDARLRVARFLRYGLFVLAALAACAFLLAPGCGGGDDSKAKKKEDSKKGSRKSKDDKSKPGSMDVDPHDPINPSEELQNTVKRLGAKDEKYWKPAQEKLETMGEAAIPGLNWAMTWTLQNLRARACMIMSKMRKSEKMIPGLLEALQKWETDTDPAEAGIRRWAARCMADLANSHTLENVRARMDAEKEPGVVLLLGYCVGRLGLKDQVPLLLEGLRSDNAEVAGIAAECFADLLPKSGLKAEGFAAKSLEERGKAFAEAQKWWEANKEGIRLAKGMKKFDPIPVVIEIRVAKPPAEEIPPEDLDEVELNIRDADEALAKGDARAAAGRLRQAFDFSKRTRIDVGLRWHEVWRSLGPDNAEKSYLYLKDKMIPLDPLNDALYIAAAQSALASGGDAGKRWAKMQLETALTLDPDNEKARELMKQTGG